MRFLFVLIVLASGSLIGCRSHAPSGASVGVPPPARIALDPAAAQAPAAPFDDTPITPVETVGASSHE